MALNQWASRRHRGRRPLLIINGVPVHYRRLIIEAQPGDSATFRVPADYLVRVVSLRSLNQEETREYHPRELRQSQPWGKRMRLDLVGAVQVGSK